MVERCRRDKYRTNNKFYSFYNHIKVHSPSTVIQKQGTSSSRRRATERKSKLCVSHQQKTWTEPQANASVLRNWWDRCAGSLLWTCHHKNGGWENSQQEQVAKNIVTAGSNSQKRNYLLSKLVRVLNTKVSVCVGQGFTRPFPELHYKVSTGEAGTESKLLKLHK